MIHKDSNVIQILFNYEYSRFFIKQVSDLLVVCISDAPRMIINQFLLPFDSIDSNTVFFTNAMLGILGTVLLGKRCKKRSKLAQ